jgi:hypothetical protein
MAAMRLGRGAMLLTNDKVKQVPCIKIRVNSMAFNLWRPKHCVNYDWLRRKIQV